MDRLLGILKVSGSRKSQTDGVHRRLSAVFPSRLRRAENCRFADTLRTEEDTLDKDIMVETAPFKYKKWTV